MNSHSVNSNYHSPNSVNDNFSERSTTYYKRPISSVRCRLWCKSRSWLFLTVIKQLRRHRKSLQVIKRSFDIFLISRLFKIPGNSNAAKNLMVFPLSEFSIIVHWNVWKTINGMSSNWGIYYKPNFAEKICGAQDNSDRTKYKVTLFAIRR